MITLEKVISGALRHPKVLDSLGNALRSDLVVANPFYRQVVEFAHGFNRQHKNLPLPGDFELWAANLSQAQKAGVLEAYQRLIREDISAYTPEYLAEGTLGELRAAAARNAKARLNAINEPTPEAFLELSKAIQSIESTGIDNLADMRDVERWITPEAESELVIPSGINRLDRYIGGFGQELVFVMADTGMGKTTVLVNFATAAMLGGFDVLYITMELYPKPLLHRCYRRVTETDRVAFRTRNDVVMDEVKHWLKYARGSLRVLYQPAYSITPEDLDVVVDRYVQEFGNVDFIILDYMDLLAPSRDYRQLSLADQLGRTSHKVRAFCPKYSCAVASAAQGNRSGHNVERLRMNHLGSSYAKAQAADLVISYQQTEKESETFQGRFGLLKVRESPGRGAEIPLYINQDLMLVADLDHPNTRRIMEELGHLRLVEEAAAEAAAA